MRSAASIDVEIPGLDGLAVASALQHELPACPVADIGGRLFLSEGTVRNYLSSAIAKTGVRNRIEAVRQAETRGWL